MRIATLLPALLLAAFTAGCGHLNEMSALRRDIAEQTHTKFDPGVAFSLGPGMTQTASWITRHVDDSDAYLVSRALRDVRRIKGAVYPLDDAGDLDALDARTLPHFTRNGWELALKTVDHGDVSWVFYRERRGSVRDLYTVVLTDSELVLVRVQGHLNALLDLAIEEAEGAGTTIVDLDF
ncbi:MAG: DUF4252 domain-containing protein [Rhodothermales bacterium]|nr:DUF4252 domain-containing protein [Rhodothermales bacterium]